MRKRLISLVATVTLLAALAVPAEAAGGADNGLVTCIITNGTSVYTIHVARPIAQRISGNFITLNGVTYSATCAL